jgi:Tetratricopeptide repeat
MLAQRLADESLAACREAGHPPGVAWALSALGQVHFRQGAYVAARELFEECLAHGHAMGAPAIRLNALVYLTWTLLEQGDMAGAGARGADALELARSVLGGRSFLAAPLEAMAQVAVAADQPELALRLAGAAATLRVSGAAPVTPTQRDQLERWLRRARADGDAAASAAWIHGRPLVADEAIAQAFSLQQSLVGQRALKPVGRMVKTTRTSRSFTSLVSPR